MLLLIPDLLAPAEFLRAALPDLALPGLGRLLAFAPVVTEEPPGADFQRSTPASRWLFAQAGVPVPMSDDAPWALAFAALDGIAAEPAARALAVLSPCHFALARDHVVLSGLAGHGSVALPVIDDWRRMTSQVAGLAGPATAIDCSNNRRWHASGDWLAQLRTADPLRALGRNVDRWLPVDTDASADRSVAGPARDWRRLHNEIQMSWFAEAGEDANVNAVWLHGVAATGIVPARPPFKALAGNDGDDRWRAFAAWTATPWVAATSLASAGDADVAVLDALTLPLVAGEVGAWREALEQLDRDWFAPLSERREGSAHRIVACSENGWRGFDCRRSSWRFWDRCPLASQLLA
ncbi:hypothetical protein BH09PSE6_BH09PSE6_08490 [soil metagenome]